jgi:hypothetical protein
MVHAIVNAVSMAQNVKKNVHIVTQQLKVVRHMVTVKHVILVTTVVNVSVNAVRTAIQQ